MKTRITAIVLMISCLLSLCSCSSEPTVEKSTSTYQVTRYVLDLINIDFTPYLADSEMEIERTSTTEFVYIKLHLYFRKSTEVTQLLKKETNPDDSPYVRLPAYNNHRFAKELKDLTFTGHYMYVKTGGDLTESRKINIYTGYLGEGEGKEYYVYIFG